MSLPEIVAAPKVLLVDDDEAIRTLTTIQLEGNGFEVVTASSVSEALRLIATDIFDALITDLNMPNAGDGFTVVTAMRHSQPQALILLVSGYPDVERAMATIALEADEIIVKPFDSARLPELLHDKLLARRPVSRVRKERVSAILPRCKSEIIGEWLSQAKRNLALNHLRLDDGERTGHLPRLLDDLVDRLDGVPQMNGGVRYSAPALAHGQLRCRQGYTSSMLVHESRLLQVAVFGTLQKNLSAIDFSLLLPDVMKIADEVDAQLTQTMESFTTAVQINAA